MEQIDRENVGICLDNNHFIKSSNLAFVEALGQYVVTTHFSDCDGVEERHHMPGTGVTDWKRLTALLEEKGYEGPWLFEIRFAERSYPTDDELSELVNCWNTLMA